MDVDAEKLLYLIEARSPIYNCKDKGHANKIKIEKYWEDIANKMDCQVSDCKNKWRSLRNSYSRHLREGRTKPSGSSGKQKKKWYLADAMSFLKDYMNQHYSVSSSLDDASVGGVKDELLTADSPATLNESEQSNSSTGENSPVPSKRNRTLLSEMVARPMMEFLQSRTKEKAADNANTLFFKSLLADYEKLSSKRQRAFRMHMLSKMNDLQEEEENDVTLPFK